MKTGPFRGRVFSEGLMVVGRVYREIVPFTLFGAIAALPPKGTATFGAKC